MKKIKLIDLVDKDVAGLKANVRRQGGKYHYDYQDIPMIRTLTKVYLKKEKGEIWLRWEWLPEPDVDEHNDCGYAGIADCELHKIDEAYIQVERVPAFQ